MRQMSTDGTTPGEVNRGTRRERPENIGACLAPNAASLRNGEPLMSISHSTERPLRAFSSSQPRDSFSISTSKASVLLKLWKAIVQVGVLSWGAGCGGATPGVYARVAPFAGWIDDILKSD
jgi:secreted trypsin-like serine protease